VYTPDSRVLVQIATRAERSWPGPEVLQLPRSQGITALGFEAYCGNFEVRDGQVIHHTEFGVFPDYSGSVEPRSAALDGDHLILGSRYVQLEWRRVQ
jgi:hypothetical protein